MRVVVLANPEGERVAAFQAALAAEGLPPAAVVPWASFLSGAGLRIPEGALLRIESPGENPGVERLLLARGAVEPDDRYSAPRISAAEARRLPDDFGRIRFPRQLHLGLRAALRDIPEAPAFNAPADIAVMGDKPSCHEALAARGVPRPEVLGHPASFDELAALMARGRRVFVKLANGSSASGVAACETDGRRHQVLTTVECCGGALYNSKRLRRYSGLDEVRPLLDALCREGVLVERWIPKASLRGRTFDLRVLVVAGRARQVVVRTSASPITNLHLGNRRGDAAAARERLGEERWAAALAVAERAMEPFPGSLYGGVDVLVGTDGAARVAEVNAFGDLLRRENPYRSELEALAARVAP